MSGALHHRYGPLLIAAVAMILLPAVMHALGLTVNTACSIVTLAVAVTGLNLLVGYTGLTSFGHSTWFGIGAYAAALSQIHWFPGQIALPILFSVAFVAALSAVLGMIILRRRGVYFSLLTLALAALAYAIAFRWTDVTGGEDGLGGLVRGRLGPVNLDDSLAYYGLVCVIGLGVLYLLLRVIRSPFGHVLLAVRENPLRATFQGYPIERYKLAVFILAAAVTGLAGGLDGFQHYLVSADATSIAFSGELLAMVVIGGMRNILGPALGALFYVLFRELFSIWTSDWLLWFGLVFVAFVMYSPSGLTGIWAKLQQRRHPARTEAAAMSGRKIYEGMPLPGFIARASQQGTVLEADRVSKYFGGIRALADASVALDAREVHALIGPNGAGKTTLFNLISGLFPPDQGAVRLHGKEIQRLAPHRICAHGLARSFQITSLFRGLPVYENLRLSVQACHPGRFNAWRDTDSYTEIHAMTMELVKFLGLEGIEMVESGALSYGGQRLVDLGIALASNPRALLLDEPLAGLAAAERERVCGLIKTIAASVPVLIVEHDIDRVLGLSGRVTVMNQGQVLMAGTPEEVRADRRVQQIYTGSGSPASGRIAEATGSNAQLLRLERVNAYYGKSHILNNANLDVRDGEIVALLGRNGAGKSTLLKTLAGLVPASSGTIEYAGRDIARLPTPEIARLGIGYVPQGRGLFAGMTVADNLALGRMSRGADNGAGVCWSEQEIYEMFPRLAERRNVAADYLSGGEQQMAAVARALSRNIQLLLLDEPFEGLAPAVVNELFRVFDQLRGKLAIVIVEHNLDLVLALADRVFVLERGAVFHKGPAEPLLTDLDYRKRVLWL